jgi:hypothetical protein
LARLLPAPELISPALDDPFFGPNPPRLRWFSVETLAGDEYDQVDVEYNCQESSPRVRLWTRTTQISLPTNLYRAPNCHVFNWQVTLMKQLGTTPDGAPIGQPVSYSTFHGF